MKQAFYFFIISLFICQSVMAQGVDTLRRENGVVFLGIPLVSSPNTIDGFGSADNGEFGEDYVYTYIEQNDSYNNINLEGSSWMSYGQWLPDKFPNAIELGLGFAPDTFKWNFHIDTLFVEVKDAETSNTQEYTFLYEVFEGANPGPLDSLHIREIDGTLVEPSIVQVFTDQSTTSNITIEESIHDLTLSPNPSKGKSSLSFSLDYGQDVTWEILTVDGKLIYSSTSFFVSGKHEIPLEIFDHNGLYFVQLKSEGIKKIKKWLVLE